MVRILGVKNPEENYPRSQYNLRIEQPTVGILFFLRACVMATDARAVLVNSAAISSFRFDFDDPACLRMKSQLYSNEGNIT